jgi:DNA-binding NtrC family response regulator
MRNQEQIVLLSAEHREMRQALADRLNQETGALVIQAESPESALEKSRHVEVSVLITDLFSPSERGMELIRTVKKEQPGALALAAVPLGDRQRAVEILQHGADFYINTPFEFQEATVVARRALALHQMLNQHRRNRQELRESDGFMGIVGSCSKMQELFELIKIVGEDNRTNVLIQGESGTGKELVAKALHACSHRSKQNFVPVNCAAIPDELLESELFGYEKGAFTGAIQGKKGRIHHADGGTLFLDEIGDMNPALQAKLLRVLQEREFEPIGSVKPIQVDVRIIAATNMDLEKAVAEGNFREDLYYRLSVVPIRVPPLRERKEDIPLLVEKFIQLYKRGDRPGLKGVSPEALEVLRKNDWPGNIRELKNLIQRLSVLNSGKMVRIKDLPERYLPEDADSISEQGTRVANEPLIPEEMKNPGDISEDVLDNLIGNGSSDFNTQVSEFEDRLILQALIATRGNKKQAAQKLNLKRTTLLEKIKKKNLDKIYEDMCTRGSSETG